MFGGVGVSRLAVSAGVVFAIIGLSLVASYWAAGASFAKPHLNVVFYLVEDSDTELFPSDEYGNVIASAPQKFPVLTGVNNLEIPLDRPMFSDSSLLRLDPCECDSSIAIARISLTTAFLTEEVPISSWGFAGDTQTALVEGTVVTLRSTPGALDPQIVLYVDLDEFFSRASDQAFWSVFGALLAIGLVVGFAMTRLTRLRSKLGSLLIMTRLSRPRVVRVPPLVFLVSVMVVASGVFMQFYGALSSGVTLDESLHVGHLTNYFAKGVYSSPTYGPATSLLGHIANNLLGVETWGTVLTTAEAYSVRHATVAGIGALGVTGVALISRVILGSWGWALVSAAMLSSIPLWVGHSMFNIKDIPVAAGYTLVTASLVLLISDVWTRWVRISLGTLLFFSGCFVAIGTRPGAVALVAVSSLGAISVFLVMRFSSWSSKYRRRVVAGLIVACGASVALILSSVGLDLRASIERSLDFPWEGWNLYGGERVESRPGLQILAAVMASYLPLIVGALALVGVGAGVLMVFRSSGSQRSLSAPTGGLVIVLVQALGAFFAVAALNPVIYDGGRQILFVIPALAFFAAYGLRSLICVLTGLKSYRIAITTVATVVAVGLVAPMFSQVQLFPYNYSFYNVAAQGGGVNGSWETDYWGSSIREAATVVAPGDSVTCRSVGDLNFSIETLEPCSSLAPYVGGAAVSTNSVLEENHFWVIRQDRTLLLHGPIASDNCKFHSQVTRPLRGEPVSMAWVYQCEDR